MLVVISNMLKRYSFQIPVLYVQQLYSCYYLERLLIIGLILSCRCYCFIIGPTDSIDYYFLRYVRSFDLLSIYLRLTLSVCVDDFRFQILRSFVPLSSDFRFQFVR